MFKANSPTTLVEILICVHVLYFLIFVVALVWTNGEKSTTPQDCVTAKRRVPQLRDFTIHTSAGTLRCSYQK